MDNIFYIIAPDIHGRTFWEDLFTEYDFANSNNKVIFLGDYHDLYSNEGLNPRNSIENFKKIIQLKKDYPDRVILLLGNHDLHYIARCYETCRMDYRNWSILHDLFINNLDLFKITHFDRLPNGKSILFSHAGVSRIWLKHTVKSLYDAIEDYKDDYVKDSTDVIVSSDVAAWEEMFTYYTSEDNKDIFKIFENDLLTRAAFDTFIDENDGQTHRYDLSLFGNYLNMISYARGGWDNFCGSCVWTDISEWSRKYEHEYNLLIPGLIQIVGHSQLSDKFVHIEHKDTDTHIYDLDVRHLFCLYTDGHIDSGYGEVINEYKFNI